MLVGIIQFTNYTRAMQIMAIVSVINNLLKHLDEKMMREFELEEDEINVRFDERATSMKQFEMIERCRELFMRIWRVHQMVNDLFGASFIVITMNAFLCQIFSFYFSIITTRRFVDFFSQTFLHIFHITTILAMLIVFCEQSDKLVNI
jgi:hypothetical protein